ncbi:hypothetical protein [Hyalangium rubrum]|uniref:Uncharacterized protein n=1 Tax=Hyalangium rubrum TaxID=3103134 RepID=A0ABU5HD17_9BACT|nr:hypothetical protein [Hyalangium sp. s54d21]MDY7230728.1 hypothetical protein [Hyalangium sp. s54d21]
MTLPLASLLSLLATVAVAQESDAPMSAPPLPSASDPCSSAEEDYTSAFNALLKGRDEEALGALERVLATCPTHPYAGEFARFARSRLGPGAELAEAALTSGEKPTGFARGGLVVWQTMHGASQGILLCVIADCDARGGLGAALLGAGVGATASLLLTPNGVTPGQSAVINSGTTWGVWYGITAISLLDMNDSDAEIGTVMFSMASLTGAGVALAMLTSPTAGQVSLTNSGGLWAGGVMALFLATADSGDMKTFFAIESAVTSVGLLSFALLSQSVPISRGRVLLIDSGGILGGLLGAAAVALVTEDGDPILFGAGVGALAGLGFTTWLTRDFDAPDSAAPQVSFAPTLMGREGAGLVLGGRF